MTTQPTAPASSPNPSTLVRENFPASRLSFAHDPAWTSSPLIETSSFTSVVTFLSTQPLHEPCVSSTPTPGIEAVTCGEPVTRLTRGGLLIRWYSWGIPGLRLNAQPGTPRTIDGHPARVSDGAATRECRSLGGTRSVQAWIGQVTMSSHEELMVMAACLSRPAQVHPVMAMLTTVRLGPAS